MTDHSRTDDVLSAIDGALSWDGAHSDRHMADEDHWEADAMRWSGANLDTADDRREASQGAPQPGQWDRGYSSAIPPALAVLDEILLSMEARTSQHYHQRMMDLLIFGNYYVDENGDRVDPTRAINRHPQWPGPRSLVGVYDEAQGVPNFSDHQPLRTLFITPNVAHVPSETDLLDSLRQALTPAAMRAAAAMRAWVAPLRRVGTHFARLGDAATAPPAVESPRDRALRMRRERNTGPDANPFVKRGLR